MLYETEKGGYGSCQPLRILANKIEGCAAAAVSELGREGDHDN